MKITIGEIVNALPALSRLAEEKLTVQSSVKLARLLKKLQIESEIYDQQRIKLCEKHGKLNKENGYYMITNVNGFNIEYSELIAQETTIDFDKITLEDDIKITAKEFLTIETFINIEEE